MKRTSRILSIGVASVALAVAARAAEVALTTTYHANDPIGRNVVMIESRAPLETMLTRTGNVVGEIKLNPQNAWDNPQARFELDMASLDTGIAMRNEHMRGDKWLDTAKYPKAVFTLTRIVVPENVRWAAHPLEDAKKLNYDVEGTLEMHGATKPVQAKVEVIPIKGSGDTAQRLPGDLLHVRATFAFKLDEYGIDVPAPSRLKIANEQQVTVDIFTSTKLPEPKS